MLRPEQVATVRRLLRRHVSQRQIARRVGCSRSTVSTIAHGRDRARPRRVRDLPDEPGAHERCPGCGGKVLMPCRACRDRAIRERARARGDGVRG